MTTGLFAHGSPAVRRLSLRVAGWNAGRDGDDPEDNPYPAERAMWEREFAHAVDQRREARRILRRIEREDRRATRTASAG